MTFNVYRILWMLLQLLYSITNFLVFVLTHVRKMFEELLSKTVTDELEFISHHVKLLVKVPSHLVVIIGNECVSFSDIANIAVWCLAAGISFVSFYDHNGVLKEKEASLVKALTKRLGSKELMTNIIWGKTTTANGYVKKNGTNGTNGYSSPRVTVNTFSLADGKGSLVGATNELCNLKASSVSQEAMEQMLNAKLCIPEPEVAFYCGQTCSTYGFMPWLIRLTEFVQLQTHHNIQVTDFVRLLNKYGECKQRFGK